ncbi:MAG: rcc01693 family protein [Devosia sp.]
MTQFPWNEAMRFGFGTLRLSSRSFWGLTPRELAAAFEAASGPHSGSPDRRRLDDLMRRYPDGK